MKDINRLPLKFQWTTVLLLISGYTVVFGNPLPQEYIPHNLNNQHKVTIDTSTKQSMSEIPTENAKIAFSNNSKKEDIVRVLKDLVNKMGSKEITKELILPKQPLVTFAGYELINTKSIWHTYAVKSYDNPTNIFSRINQSKILRDLNQIESIATALKSIKTGTILRAKSYNGALEQLVFTSDYKNSFVVVPTKSGSFEGSWQQKQFEVRQERATYTIKNGLFLDAKKVGIPKNIMDQVVTIFSEEINFSTGARINDQITVVFEQIYHEADIVGSQNLLAAQFIHKDEIYRSIRHTTARGQTDYFTPEGLEMKRAFIRKPVVRARVSSHFNPNRLHPVLKKIRPHTGTDFAARQGTPVIATGDGKVKLIGRKKGYGKTIVLNHKAGFTTFYSHLSKFKQDLKKGYAVEQGDVIGFVGSTGLATGPNLHYELRKNNTPVDPITTTLPNSMSLTKKELVKFKTETISERTQLEVLHRFAKNKVGMNLSTGG